MSTIFVLLFLYFGKGFSEVFILFGRKNYFGLELVKPGLVLAQLAQQAGLVGLIGVGIKPYPDPLSSQSLVPLPPLSRCMRRHIWRRCRCGSGRSRLRPALRWWASGIVSSMSI
jgi:hypothetical protein